MKRRKPQQVAPAPSKIGHSIAAVSFGERRHLRCSCGLVLFQSESDDAQGSRFYSHRQVAPPERLQRAALRGKFSEGGGARQ